MEPFVNSHGFEDILVAVDYVSKWVEAMPCRVSTTRELKTMMQNCIFPRYGVPRVVITDGGSHFTRTDFTRFLVKSGVAHRIGAT